MYKIEDVMTKNVLSIKAKAKVYDAAKMLIDHNISGLPVVDDTNNLIGIISERDIMKLLIDEPTIDKQTVDCYMTSNVKSFTLDDSVVDICEYLIENPIRRVPIVAEGKLKGIVSRHDIIKLILNIRGEK
ncbi:MAG: CBS domain-containing protein [Candidatus Omnitrophica bacterium]|nr:CBS domain-containing protein [Candidatus Omnitrophota bacterium]